MREGVFRRQEKYLKRLSGEDTAQSKMMKIAGQLEDKYQYILI